MLDLFWLVNAIILLFAIAHNFCPSVFVKLSVIVNVWDQSHKPKQAKVDFAVFVSAMFWWSWIIPSASTHWTRTNADTKFFVSIQANSENCGPPLGNNFDLEVGQRSRSQRSINWKGLVQWSCMPNINALSFILQKIWARLKFLWQTKGQTDEQTDGRMSFNVPCFRFRERRGTKTRSA